MSDDIVRVVADISMAVGLEVHGLGGMPSFSRVPMVYGPLDSIAILVDALTQYAPRRYRRRRILINVRVA